MQEDVRPQTTPKHVKIMTTDTDSSPTGPAVISHDYAEAEHTFGDFSPAYQYLEIQKAKLKSHLQDLENGTEQGPSHGRLSNFWLDIAYDAASRDRRRRRNRPRTNGHADASKTEGESATDNSTTSHAPWFERPMFIKPTEGTQLDTSVRRPRGALAPATLEDRETDAQLSPATQVDLTPKIYRRISNVAAALQTVFPVEAERLQRIVEEPEIALGDRGSRVEWEDGVAKLVRSDTDSVPTVSRHNHHSNGLHIFLDQ